MRCGGYEYNVGVAAGYSGRGGGRGSRLPERSGASDTNNALGVGRELGGTLAPVEARVQVLRGRIGSKPTNLLRRCLGPRILVLWSIARPPQAAFQCVREGRRPQSFGGATEGRVIVETIGEGREEDGILVQKARGAGIHGEGRQVPPQCAGVHRARGFQRSSFRVAQPVLVFLRHTLRPDDVLVDQVRMRRHSDSYAPRITYWWTDEAKKNLHQGFHRSPL